MIFLLEPEREIELRSRYKPLRWSFPRRKLVAIAASLAFTASFWSLYALFDLGSIRHEPERALLVVGFLIAIVAPLAALYWLAAVRDWWRQRRHVLWPSDSGSWVLEVQQWLDEPEAAEKRILDGKLRGIEELAHGRMLSERGLYHDSPSGALTLLNDFWRDGNRIGRLAYGVGQYALSLQALEYAKRTEALYIDVLESEALDTEAETSRLPEVYQEGWRIEHFLALRQLAEGWHDDEIAFVTHKMERENIKSIGRRGT